MTPLNTNLLKEIDILWITAGLGCDGESIAMTAATQLFLFDAKPTLKRNKTVVALTR